MGNIPRVDSGRGIGEGMNPRAGAGVAGLHSSKVGGLTMSSGLRESRHFARRQRRRRFLKYVFMLTMLAGLGLVSFETGRQLSEAELRQARHEVSRVTAEIATLRQEAAQAQEAAEAARAERTEMQRRYEADVPTGDRLALLDLVDEQLAKGADPDRVRFLIAASSNEERCDGAPVTRRFMVRTPLYEGIDSVVTLANAALTVTARGEPATDPQGQILAWFDPMKPISLEIVRLGGRTERVDGTLPLQHALVVNSDEYRMSFVAGERRGFVNVTADRCRFP
jgi:hypothetical protein